KSQKVQLSFVLNGQLQNHPLVNRWKAIAKTHFTGDLWHSVWLNFQPAKNNVIFGQEWMHIQGPEYIWEEIAGVLIAMAPSHFGQGNQPLFEQLLNDMKSLIQPNARALECYAGVGVIAIAVADRCQSIILSEREKSAEVYFEIAKAKLAQETQKKLQFITADAAKMTTLFSDIDTVIVDPPRKGLDKSFLEALTLSKTVKQLIYVSCNFSSFQQDAEVLLKAGWKITSTKSYLFFPGTNHIELLSIFHR
ncbi:MAG TPA: RsmD family RNA methyltransferase, partial [Chlamydiales bacterium]|nr:RsmD family RNA methyltransferase [Chlamydiales bacterium]